MSLLDFFRKKLLGEANVMQPSGFEPGVNTQGLFGQGGQFGGGLLQSNLSQMNQGENGLLGNIPQAAILGSAIYGQGVKGKDPLEAFFPAAMQTASFTKAMQPKKTELQKNLEAAGYKAGSPEYKAALGAYLNKGKTNTLSQEVLNVYNKMKGKSGEDFDDAFADLSEPEQKLYRNKIEGNTDILDKFILDSMENLDTAINLTSMPDEDALQIGQKYEIQGKFYRWDGKKMKLSN